jgi:hypothetical protein
LSVEEVKNISLKKHLTVILLFTVLFLTISSISAHDLENDTDDNLQSNFKDDLLLDDEIPDIPDLVEDVSNNVTPTNIGAYFQNSELNEKYKGQTLIFSGNFENFNQLTIKSDDVKLLGNNAKFKNTVFNIESNGLTLKDFTFESNKAIKSNDGAVISVNGENVSLVNLNISYTVPNDVEAYAIYADGYNGDVADCLKIINSTIYFEGHNFNTNKYNCAVKLTWANSLLMENNTITSRLPLKNVNYGVDGATLDSDYVYVLGLERCDDFIVNNNTFICDVNKRTAVQYPTLNCVMLSKSDNGLFSNNSIFVTDFLTYPGVENYIYGLDIYKLNNLLVADNKISIVTTGGKLALGTAYPIQVCGPISGINITRNDLYSFSNGPNIGIYSQNFYGPTDISITFNKINVTGLAGIDEWALVTGIESQDTNAEILNNYIEVHSVAPVSINDNLYAISYRQSTAGSHSFDIQNNFAITNGYYAVYLLSSDYSTIVNNTLVSFNDDVETGDDSYRKGPRNHDDYSRDNMAIHISDYYKSINNIDMSQNFNSNSNSIISGERFSQNNNKQVRPTSNPLIPFYSNNNNVASKKPIDTVDTDETSGYVDDGSVQGNIDDGNINNKRDSQQSYDDGENQEAYVDSQSLGDVEIDGSNFNARSNSSDLSPSLNGNDNPLSKSQSPDSSGASQSVSKKVYELDELVKNEEKFIPSIFFIIVILALLVVGYKRKNSDFN